MKITLSEWKTKCAELTTKLVKNISSNGNKKYVYGVPRGGTLVAQYIANHSDFILTDEPNDECIVVDDLIDSGQTKAKYNEYQFYALIDKRKMKDNPWVEFWYEQTDKDSKDIITRQLEFIGEDPNREGLIDTPKRVIKMWKELFRGYNKELEPKVTMFNNGSDGIIYDQMICDTGNLYSHCEHHMVPFFGQYYFAYVPHTKGKLIGLSKVARVVDYCAAKLQIQERLTHEVVDYIWNKLCNDKECKYKPLGMALVMECEHLCKTMRGAKKKGTMRTTKLIGNFKEDPSTREEFMGWVNSNARL